MNTENLVIVRWIDIASHDGAWMDYSDAVTMKPIQVETVGWVIKENPEYIVVAASISPDKEESVTGSINAIPRGCISFIKDLEARA